MSEFEMKFEAYGEAALLLCPLCGDSNTHVDVVKVAARRAEDSEINEITVQATGRVTTHGKDPAPAGPEERQGRRHRIALLGWCENRHEFAIVFTQHKGSTLVEVVSR